MSLKILYDLKAIENNDENASMVNDIIELLRNSIEYRKSKNKIKWVHSHEALKDLEILIKGLKINSVKSKKDFSLYKHYQITSNVDWVIDIFLLVTFHQSLKNCESHMNDPLLTEEEVAVFFNAELLELMKVLMINDSLSRSRFLIDNSENEISKNMNNYINYIK